MITNLYIASLTLERIDNILAKAKGKLITQTPDGRDPVYWPITIHGETGMIKAKDSVSTDKNNLPKVKNHLS